jgi:hypothetical protein
MRIIILVKLHNGWLLSISEISNISINEFIINNFYSKDIVITFILYTFIDIKTHLGLEFFATVCA